MFGDGKKYSYYNDRINKPHHNTNNQIHANFVNKKISNNKIRYFFYSFHVITLSKNKKTKSTQTEGNIGEKHVYVLLFKFTLMMK